MNHAKRSSQGPLYAQATLGGGCFWCMEAIFERLPGVLDVVSGYAGGHVPNPTYRQVCTGTTGHAEVIQITFDPTRITYRELLEVFWQIHDPTTPNRQGQDVGSQYRSIILASKQEAQKRFAKPIVTEIVPLTAFYPAEPYHQDFFQKNPENSYCRMIILPKLDALQAYLLRKESE